MQKLTHYNSWGLQVSATPSSSVTLMTWKSHCIPCKELDHVSKQTFFTEIQVSAVGQHMQSVTVVLNQWLIQTEFPLSHFHFSEAGFDLRVITHELQTKMRLSHAKQVCIERSYLTTNQKAEVLKPVHFFTCNELTCSLPVPNGKKCDI